MEIRSVDAFLRYFANIHERTMRASRCVPPDKVNWSYASGKFTLGDLLRHIAVTERYLFAENVQGRPSCYTTHGPELAANLDDILALMERLHSESMTIFSGLTDEDLQRKRATVSGAETTVARLLRSMTEHEIHHRGQLYVYLGMIGAPTPPLFGIPSEQVRAQSRAS